MTDYPLLIQVLRQPQQVSRLSSEAWSLLMQQARAGQLSGKLCTILQHAGLLDSIPEKPRLHLQSALQIAEAHQLAVKWEITQLENSLSELGIPLILLKGAAYAADNLAFAKGRLFSDIDILVPRERLDEVEQTLLKKGWLGSHHNTYDQYYYRKWMHEIPPLKHRKRQTLLDIHHNLAPLTGNLHPDAEKLIRQAIPVEADCFREIYRLDDKDMLLHSMTHLFQDGEFHNGLRDLVDIASMIDYFFDDTEFWQQIIPRAIEMDMLEPFCYGIECCRQLLDTHVPARIGQEVTKRMNHSFRRRFMARLFRQALASEKPRRETPIQQLAGLILYVRSHAVKMPLYLLIPHLMIKAVKRQEDNELPRQLQKFLEKNQWQ